MTAGIAQGVAGSGTRGQPRAQAGLLSPDPVLHLVRRATFGPTAALLAEVRAQGTDRWLDDQLNPARIDDSACEAILARWPTLTASLAQLNGLAKPRQASTDLIQATVARQIFSRRQLFEVMVDFWSNHFNIVAPHPSSYTSKPIDERTVIRPNALGRFEDMLLASAKSAAMMTYLNNAESEGDDPNENYGREIMQLHTVGSDAGYTEDDVRSSALVLTGRSTDGHGAFQYKPGIHHVGPVSVMGWSSANSSANAGMSTSDGYLRYLARHASTAAHLALKLATRFVSDAPPQSLIDSMAGAYLDSGTQIVPMLQELFNSAAFASSVGQKTRRPLEDIAATMRILGVQPPAANSVKEFGNLVSDATRMGQPPLGCFPPTGYPDVAEGWRSVGTTLALCNLRRNMVRGYPRGMARPDVSTFLAGPAMATYGDMIDRLTTSVTGQVFRDDHRTALLNYAGLSESGAYDQRTVDQWLADLTELVLDSAYRVLR